MPVTENSSTDRLMSADEFVARGMKIMGERDLVAEKRREIEVIKELHDHLQGLPLEVRDSTGLTDVAILVDVKLYLAEMRLDTLLAKREGQR